MIRIIIDARSMGSQPSGIGFYTFDFLKELIHAPELQISLITDVAESEQILYLQRQKISISCYGKKIYRSAGVYAYFNFIRNCLVTEQPNLFWEPNNLIPIRLHGFLGKIVLTIHDLFPMTNPNYFNFLYRIYFRIGIRRSVRYADALLFDSDESRRFVHRYYPAVTYKSAFISYLIVSIQTSLDTHDGGYFLYIGNIERRKGSDLLIKAYELYCRKGGAMPLYLGGRICEKKLQTLFDETARRCPTLHHLGYLSQEEKERWLAGCSCFLFPSKAEGFGLPPLEAMKYGKRVIVSNLPIFQEILCGAVESFDIDCPEEQQIERLSRCMASDPEAFRFNKAETYATVLKRYNARILSESLKNFMLKLEDDGEDSI